MTQQLCSKQQGPSEVRSEPRPTMRNVTRSAVGEWIWENGVPERDGLLRCRIVERRPVPLLLITMNKIQENKYRTIEKIGSKFDKACRIFEIAEMIINETLIFFDRKNSGLTFMDYSSILEPIESSTVQIYEFKNLISDFEKYSLEQKNINLKVESITRRVNERKRGSLIGFMESKSNTKYSLI
ncbi:hypothetical protein BpHYR1_046558 [Brachionus plicatilis]|uniref:Uncharacterized protein n=1 Tax=Brachionus plicatilis TaxID=10195 RepID=A0A3M7R9N0_BRAPC|nr:hypothetical protein BpHYR1_046558 [Brachionus plicatilis]